MTHLVRTRSLRTRAAALTIGACAAALLTACGGGDSPAVSASLGSAPAAQIKLPFTGPTPPMPLPGEPVTAPPAPLRAQGTLESVDGGWVVDTGDRQAVKLLYRTVYASSNGVAEGWTGSVATCDAGDLSSEYRAAVLRRVNWFRAMAGVPANIQFDPTYNAKAQQAALMMAANNTLSHYPPTSWACYTADGADGAGHSNLGLGSDGLKGATRFVLDEGSNNSPVGHRRWELYPQAQFMGVGSVTSANALWVVGGAAPRRPAVRDEFVAWPPKGHVPYQTVYPRWSLSYRDADFSAATVTMTENGSPIATRLEPLTNPGAGENTIVWFPGTYTDGAVWARPAADTVYQVTVSNVRVGGVARTFAYTTTVFDPDEPITATTVSGPAKLVASQEGSYSVAAAPGEDGWQWRSLVGAPFTFADGAEAGTGSFVVSTSGSYDLASSDTAASGARSFHLAGKGDEILQLRQPLIIPEGAYLTFASRLQVATTIQVALVELSLDDGAHWTAVYRQAGAGATGTWGESSFTTRTVSLAPYAGRSALLRWRYTSSGSWYPQTDSGYGWYVDDIRLHGVEALSWAGGAVDAGATGFTVAVAQPGTVYLQGRGRAYGYPLEWGIMRAISVNAAGADPFDCVLDWAERSYPQLLLPAKPTSRTEGVYYYRGYPASNSYVGLSAADDHVYFLSDGVMEDLGVQDRWLTAAGCAKPL